MNWDFVLRIRLNGIPANIAKIPLEILATLTTVGVTFGGQLVKAGEILVRQRGTHFATIELGSAREKRIEMRMLSRHKLMWNIWKINSTGSSQLWILRSTGILRI